MNNIVTNELNISIEVEDGYVSVVCDGYVVPTVINAMCDNPSYSLSKDYYNDNLIICNLNISNDENFVFAFNIETFDTLSMFTFDCNRYELKYASYEKSLSVLKDLVHKEDMLFYLQDFNSLDLIENCKQVELNSDYIVKTTLCKDNALVIDILAPDSLSIINCISIYNCLNAVFTLKNNFIIVRTEDSVYITHISQNTYLQVYDGMLNITTDSEYAYECLTIVYKDSVQIIDSNLSVISQQRN